MILREILYLQKRRPTFKQMLKLRAGKNKKNNRYAMMFKYIMRRSKEPIKFINQDLFFFSGCDPVDYCSNKPVTFTVHKGDHYQSGDKTYVAMYTGRGQSDIRFASEIEKIQIHYKCIPMEEKSIKK